MVRDGRETGNSGNVGGGVVVREGKGKVNSR